MSTDDALVLVFARNSFYKRLHYLALLGLTIAILIICALSVMLIFLMRNPTHPLYFATDKIGRLIRVVPVQTPNMSEDDVIAWTIQAIEKAFSYDFVNYRSQLQSAEKYFTSFGWSNYMNSLVANNNLVALTQRQQITIAKVVERPKIIAQGILGGSYAWKFQMPVLITYWEPPFDKPKFANPITLQAIVQRQPILESYLGLGVVQVVASIVTPPTTQVQEISETPTG